jgi:DNA-binding PadR family transcriptional regulator
MMASLLYIDDAEPVLKTDIYRDVSGGVSILSKLNTLEDLGLIESYSKPRSNSSFMVLTPKGRRVVATIRLMLPLIDDSSCPIESLSSSGSMLGRQPSSNRSEL